MLGGYSASLSLVLWAAGRLPPESTAERNELLVLYMVPATLMYMLVRFFPSLVEQIVDKSEGSKGGE
jgi:hypothetical protein